MSRSYAFVLLAPVLLHPWIVGPSWAVGGLATGFGTVVSFWVGSVSLLSALVHCLFGGFVPVRAPRLWRFLVRCIQAGSLRPYFLPIVPGLGRAG